MQYIYFGHHKCASTWILSILYSICGKLGWTLEIFKHNEPHNLEGIDFVVDVGARPSSLDPFQDADFLGFHVIRDPRDIVVSAYFSHKYSHPLDDWLVKERELLNRVEFEEGFRHSIDSRARQFDEMGTWDYESPYVFETRFELITTDPESVFAEIFHFLGLYPKKISRKRMAKILHYHRFKRLASGRAKGEEDPQHHYRKGIVGDWSNYLVGENKEYFKERYGQLLIDLGYEANFEW